ncbi:hypothetical protein OZX56_07565 [Lactobacillus sp. ESL0684]|uniref:hypothetical protein n=1 Tax=Lactobacillus sp. ESL0684 TaxID=2983213 RepID=UPI0023F9E79B|nr:hypothetical protein [Lactobacillus sp. ESL0684]WEV43351.1 hypothetical protein OZX56_07565 [Lactobacillus sp. ESL0684]
MNEQEFLNRFKNKIFSYQVKADVGNWMSVQLAPRGDLAIIFASDHTLKFPSHVGFYPTERCWEFDEANQQIILKDIDNTKILSQYQLPQTVIDHQFILTKVNEPKNRYICYETIDFDQEVNFQPDVLACQRLILLPEQTSSDEEQKLLQEYTIKYCCEAKQLTPPDSDPWSLIETAWSAITNDTNLKTVCLILAGQSDLSQELLNDQLTIQNQPEQATWISGQRDQVIVVLAQLLVKHYHEQLAEGSLSTPLALLPTIVTE